MLVGKTLRSRYKIIKQLRSGGFGDTYLAEDGDLPDHLQCVVKHLKPNPDPAVLHLARRIFSTEAQVLYKLGNECDQIPRLLAHFEENGEFYLVQEFVDGHDLSQELTPPDQGGARGGRLSENEVIELLEDILEVLVLVHQQQVIHRDIKPQHLIRRRKDGKIALIDFGAIKRISTLIVNAQGQPRATTSIGTPGYMPIEQANGHPKLCSDIYSVGMVGIQSITGLSPHQLQKDPKTLEVIWHNQAQVSKRLADVLSTMVRHDFSQRYQSAAGALQALKRQPPKFPLRKALIGVGVAAVAAIAGIKFLPPDSSTQSYSPPKVLVVKYIPGHSNGVSSIAISSDGQTLASGSFDKTIKVSNLRTGQEIQSLRGHSGRVLSVAIHPKEPILATGSDDKTIKLWNLKTGQEIRTLFEDLGWVYSVAFSPDGQTLVSGSDKNTVKIWKLGTEETPRTFLGHSALIRAFAFSSDGQILVSSSADQTIKIWNLGTGELLHNLDKHSGWVNSVAISPDGQYLASGSSDKTIKIWNLNTGKLIRDLRGHESGISSVAFSPDGQSLASGSSDNTIRLWNWHTGEPLNTLDACIKGVSSVAFSLDGQTLVSGCWDKTIKVWLMSP